MQCRNIIKYRINISTSRRKGWLSIGKFWCPARSPAKTLVMTKSSTGLLAVCYKPPASLPPIPELAWTKWSHLGTFVQGAGHKLRVPRSQIFLRIIMINDNNNNGIQYTFFWRRKVSCTWGLTFPKRRRFTKNTAKWINNKREIYQSQTWEQHYGWCVQKLWRPIPDVFRESMT